MIETVTMAKTNVRPPPAPLRGRPRTPIGPRHRDGTGFDYLTCGNARVAAHSADDALRVDACSTVAGLRI